MFIDLLLSTIDSGNTLSILDYLSDLGTIFAGFAAATALCFDIHTRLFGKHPTITIFLEAHEKEPINTNFFLPDEANFFLVVQNIGNAAACINSLDTVPGWEMFNNTPYAKPLKLAQNHILLPNQALKIPMDRKMLTLALKNYYENEVNLSKPYIIKASASYQPIKHHIFGDTFLSKRKIKNVSFDLNLTSTYMSVLPLNNVTPTDPFRNCIAQHCNQPENKPFFNE